MNAVAIIALLATGIVAQTPAADAEIARRSSAAAVFTFQVAADHHVQANPATNEFLIPTSLELREVCGLKAGAPTYPAPHAFRLEGTDHDLAVWDGTFQVVVPLRAGRFARRGTCVIRGTLVYQACDERTCLAPTSLDVELPIRIR